MTLQEKQLYHQIHPLKLLTDWGTGLIALYFLWQHNLLTGLIIGIVPSILVSFILVRYASLEAYKESQFGRYIAKNMTRAVEAWRLIGYAVMALGAWMHWVWLIPVGLLVILLAWSRGILFQH